MRRWIWLVLLVSSPWYALAAGGSCNSIPVPSGVTSCFYVAPAGADTNAGTSEASPWKHAPGLTNCANTCASTTPTSAEGFIFEQGQILHRSASTNTSPDTAIGGEWVW